MPQEYRIKPALIITAAALWSIRPRKLRSGRLTVDPFLAVKGADGVFAVGDVRSGSVKRIGGAIGEGAAVVSQLHVALADPATTAR